MKKKKNKIDLNKINVRGIVAVTIAIGIVCFEMYIRIFPLVKLTPGDNYCKIYRKMTILENIMLKIHKMKKQHINCIAANLILMVISINVFINGTWNSLKIYILNLLSVVI